MGFKQLKKASRDGTTLSLYLHHGMHLGEVKHDGKRKPYALTPKGLNELNRIENARKMKEATIRYSGEIDSLNDLTFKLPSLRESQSFLLQRSLILRELPLPISVKVAMGGSKEQAFILQDLEDYVLHSGTGIGPRKVPKAVLMGATNMIVKQFVWTNLLERLSMLYEWHAAYDKRIRDQGRMKGVKRLQEMGKPPPLTVESLLGFDISLTIQYDGKWLAKSQDVKVIRQVSRRLAGAILLPLGTSMAPDYPPSYLITLLENGNLLDKKDADRIRAALRGKHADYRAARRVIVEVAFRYLREGGVRTEIRDRVKKTRKTELTDKGIEQGLLKYGQASG